MYSKSFGDNRDSFAERYESQFTRPEPPPPPPPDEEPPRRECEKSPVTGIFDRVKDIFKGLSTDDLLLLAIGALLLLDSDEDNDVILIFIAVMLFF